MSDIRIFSNPEKISDQVRVSAEMILEMYKNIIVIEKMLNESLNMMAKDLDRAAGEVRPDEDSDLLKDAIEKFSDSELRLETVHNVVLDLKDILRSLQRNHIPFMKFLAEDIKYY